LIAVLAAWSESALRVSALDSPRPNGSHERTVPRPAILLIAHQALHGSFTTPELQPVRADRTGLALASTAEQLPMRGRQLASSWLAGTVVCSCKTPIHQ
jgi:hypothetical protein